MAGKDIEEAIPYLEKSIDEADKKEDLWLKKMPLRKLSELYRWYLESLIRLLKAMNEYANVVDELYAKKEQGTFASREIQQGNYIQTKPNYVSLENDRKLNESKYQLATRKSRFN